MKASVYTQKNEVLKIGERFCSAFEHGSRVSRSLPDPVRSRFSF